MEYSLPTATVGIPTYYGGRGLLKAVNSVLASVGVGPFRLIVCVDGNPLQKDIEKQLIDWGVEVIESKERGGQVARLNQMIGLCDTEVLVFTQDDIIFDPKALSEILHAFRTHPDITMIGARIFPIPAKKFIERVIEIGVYIVHCIGDAWEHGDNYLLANGRCLAFRSGMVKKLEVPEGIISSDSYFYFENKANGGKFLSLPSAVVYNKSPQKIQEHINQNKKFESSYKAAERHLRRNLKKEYQIPPVVLLSCAMKEFLRHPVLMVFYVGLKIYAKLHKNSFLSAKRFWETDISTKEI